MRKLDLDEVVRGRAQFLEVEETKEGPQRLYVSDGPARCIIMVDVASGHSRRLLLPSAVHHPSDVLYLTLIPPSNLYFTYYKSPDMYLLNTEELLKGTGLVRRVGSKPPGVVVIGREGKNILFRVSGSPALYSWDTMRDLNRETFKRRDPGGHGDPLHAVADLGKTWVLESDLASFLKGKRVGHRIRAIENPNRISNISSIKIHLSSIVTPQPPLDDTLPAPKYYPTTTPFSITTPDPRTNTLRRPSTESNNTTSNEIEVTTIEPDLNLNTTLIN